MSSISQVHIIAHHDTAANNPELLLLLDGGLAVDVVFIDCRGWKVGLKLMFFLKQHHLLPKNLNKQLQKGNQLFSRGMNVLVDKDRLIPLIDELMGSKPSFRPPTQAEFLELTHYFWCSIDKVARKLCRGELYAARQRWDDVYQTAVIPMLEWHAHAKDMNQDTWYAGRFLEQWADHQTLADLRESLGSYDTCEMRRALFSTMSLFRRIAVETATSLDLTYPFQEDEYVLYLLRARFSKGEIRL